MCGCGYRFALDPKVPPRVGDNFFQAVIRRTSGNQTQYFTLNQLYAAACILQARKAARSRRGCLIAFPIGVIATAAAYWYLPESARPVVYFWMLGLVVVTIAVWLSGRSLINRRNWDQAVNRWLGAGHEIPMLIEHPALLDRSVESSAPDLFAYGIERILICERDEIVDLLVLNRFHSEQGTLVVSESGYPKHLFPLAKRTISEVPSTKVFLLHDASKNGRTMESRMIERGLLTNDHMHVFDLGIDRNQALKNPWIARMTSANGNQLPVDLFLAGRLCATLGKAMSELLTITAIENRLDRQRHANDSGDGVVIFVFGDGESFVVDWGSDASAGDGDGE